MQKTILITGGAGYIGSVVGWLLAQHGYQIIILDPHIDHEHIASLSWGTLYTNEYGDTAFLDHLFTIHQISAVIHCAVDGDSNHSITDPHALYANHVVNTIALLNRMRIHHISSFVFISNCTVYGAPHIIPIYETHPCSPISPYGNMTTMIETLLRDYGTAYDINHVALRIFHAAGTVPEQLSWSPHESATPIIPLLIESALTGKPFISYGAAHETPDGTYVRDYVHVLDVAHASLRALEHLLKGNPSDCFNIGSGVGRSVRELVHAVQTIYGVTIPIKNNQPRPGDAPILVANISHAHDILGWNPRFSSLEYIARSTHRSMMQRRKIMPYVVK